MVFNVSDPTGGVGILGVGIFPGNITPVHNIFSLFTFIIGGMVAIGSFEGLSGSYRYISVLLGSITLIGLIFSGYFIPILGDGGAER
ncbi:MAG: hypothetical protein LUO93_01275 [Methanomicrobiales archaeon]|nr:hypothetical protein [Methanomicrobiales archaeon]